jgi:hypothetical protein
MNFYIPEKAENILGLISTFIPFHISFLSLNYKNKSELYIGGAGKQASWGRLYEGPSPLH